MSVLFKRKRLMAFLVVTLTMGAALFWAFSQDIRIMNDGEVETANCGPSTAGGAGYCTPSNLIFPPGCTYSNCGNVQQPQITFTTTDPATPPLGLNVDPDTIVAVGTPLTASLPDNRIAKLPGRVTIYLTCTDEPHERSASVSLDFIGAQTKSYVWKRGGDVCGTSASITPTEAGTYTVTCTVTQAIGRTLKDGTVITCASASVSATTSRTVEVIVPALTLTIVPNEIVENAGPNAATGTVGANLPAPEGGLTVGLSSSDEEEATVPAQVTIPAGQTVATFPIAAIDEEVADRDATVIITATAVAHTPATASLRVCDNDWPPTTSLKFEPTVIYESGGQAAVTVATLKHNYLPGEAFSVTLTPSDPTQVTCPAELSFAAGEFTKTFTVTASDDGQLDGRQQIVIVASGPELYASGALTVTEVRFGQDVIVVPWQENGSAALATYLTDPSVPVSWSPAERISADGTLSFGAEGEVLTVGVDGPGDTHDSLQVYVLKMDVVIDGIGESQEVTEGALLSVNNDDDDLNGVPDMNDTGLVVDEDDLIPVTVSVSPSLALMPAGMMTFTISNASTVAVWWSVDRSVSVDLPMTGLAGAIELPATFYLEGRQHSDQMRDSAVLLAYTFDDFSCLEEARFTVVEVDLSIDGVPADDEQTIGAKVPINDDDDNLNTTPDMQEVGTVDGEDDLVPMTIRVYPADLNVGDLVLQQLSGDQQCRVWLSPTRGTELALPHTWTLPGEQPPSQVYLEGVAASWGLAGMAGIDGNPPPPETILQATGLRINGPVGATDAVVTATDQALDVEVDSDNSNGYGLPDGTEEEDSIEDAPPGKWLALSHHDGDGDGISGYDDWSDGSSTDVVAQQGTPGFVPLRVKVNVPNVSDEDYLLSLVPYPIMQPSWWDFHTTPGLIDFFPYFLL